MSLAAGIGRAAARAAVTGLLGVPVAAWLEPVLGGRGGRRALVWGVLLAPLLVPALLVGYGYAGVLVPLARRPALAEAAYGALLLFRLVPVAAVVLYFAPREVSPEGMHCLRLLRRGGRLGAAGWLWARVVAGGRGPAAAFVLVFLLAFSEFELAALLGRPGWTVYVFDAQAGGLWLGRTLGLAVPAVLLQGGLLAALVALLAGGEAGTAGGGACGRRAAAWRWCYLGLAFCAVVALPAAVVLGDAGKGLRVLAGGLAIAPELLAGALFAGFAALGAYALSGPLAAGALRPGGRWPGRLAAVLACLPGLAGSLVLSLGVLALFQLPLLRAARETVLPLAVVLVLLLMPVAVVLRVLFERVKPLVAVHLARLAGPGRGAGALAWELETRGTPWLLGLLFLLAYFDLAAPSLLAPAGMVPAPVRLYNLMHYGRTEVLSAMLLLAGLLPAAVAAGCLAAWHLWGRYVHG